MPRVPQTAVARLLQGITDSRNIAPGDRISIKPHLLVLGPQDGLAVLKTFRLGGGESVADPSRVLLFSDENAAAHDKSPAQRRAQLLEAAKQCGVTSVIPNGGCEVEHLTDRALLVPGECAASNLARLSALGGSGALGLRLTVRDLAGVLKGEAPRVTVPDTVRLDLSGKCGPFVTGWDILFAARQELGHARVCGAVLEIGSTDLALHDRASLAAVAAHAGLFAAFCVPDRAAIQELNKHVARGYAALQPEQNAPYAHRGSLDLSSIQLGALPPGKPWRPLAEAGGERVSTVVIRAGLEGLRAATAIIKSHGVATGARCAVIPASQPAFGSALREGLTGYLLDAGVEVLPPGTPGEYIFEYGLPSLTTDATAPPGCWRTGVPAAAAAACAGEITHPERLGAAR